MKKIKRGEWTIIKSRNIYRNPWISVREDKVIRPDGKSGIHGIIEIKDGISVLAMDDKENVYLTQEFHYAIGKTSIETVSGGIDNKETAIQAAKRELKEELGIKASKWINLGVMDPFTTMVKSPAHLFLARGLTFSKSRQDETENINLIKIPFREAIDWVMNGKITHSTSMVLILKAKAYLNL